MMSPSIDLAQITGESSTLLAGHPRGLAVRAEFGLDQLDSSPEQVKVLIPEHINAITTSFVQGMFGGSIRRFGSKNLLLDHYDISDLSLPLQEDISAGLDRLFFSRHLP